MIYTLSVLFQSPSRRGVNYFTYTRWHWPGCMPSFSPLREGASITSSCITKPASTSRGFQSPSRRGVNYFR